MLCQWVDWWWDRMFDLWFGLWGDYPDDEVYDPLAFDL
jgi:hypothetical protein